MENGHNLMKKLHVLFVDDERLIREMVSDLLSQSVGHISVAANGQEGLEFYASSLRPVDIVISDQTMPVMNGLDMIQEIKKINPAQKCVMITAHSETAYMLRAIEIGIEHFMLKPILFDKLESILRDLALKIEQENHQKEKERCERREEIEHAFHFSLQTLVDNIPFPTLILDENDRVVASNSDILSIAAGTLHYKKLLNKELDFKELLSPDTRFAEGSAFCDWKEEYLFIGDELLARIENVPYRLKIKRMVSEDQKRFYVVCLIESNG